MEKRTRVRIVAILYLIIGVFYIVLGWNAKSWFPNMFASGFWNEANATTGARIIAIVVGVWQVLIGFCLARSKYYENGKGLSGVLMFACIVFGLFFLGSENDHVVAASDGDFMWFLNYLILIPVHLLFWLFIAGRKPKAGLVGVERALDRLMFRMRDSWVTINNAAYMLGYSVEGFKSLDSWWGNMLRSYSDALFFSERLYLHIGWSALREKIAS